MRFQLLVGTLLTMPLFFSLTASAKLKVISEQNYTPDHEVINISQNPEATETEAITNAIYLKQEGYDLFQQGNPQAALAKYQEALAIMRKFEAKAGEGDVLNYMGEVYLALGDYNQALSLFKQSLVIFQSLNKYPDFDRAYEGYSLQYLGKSSDYQGNFEAAINYYQQALSLFENLLKSNSANQDSLQTSIVYTLNPLASIYFKVGNYQKAIEAYNQILVIQAEQTDYIGIVKTYNNLGVVYANSSEYAQALEFYQKALAKLREFSNCDPQASRTICYGGDEAAILNNLASLYFSIGQYEQAINFAEQATKIYQRFKQDTRDLNPEDFQLLYDAIGAASLNANLVQQSLAIRPGVGDNFFDTETVLRQGEAVNFNNLGQLYSRQGNQKKALPLYEKALLIYRDIGNQQGIGITLNNIARVFFSLGEYERALDFNQQALEVYKKVGDQVGISVILTNLGQIYTEQRQFNQAEFSLNQALSIQEKIGDRSSIAISLSNLGLLQLKQGKTVDAITTLQQAIKVIESLRPGLNDASKVALFETQSLTYSWLQQALIKNQQINQALEVAEASKARAFVELLAQRLTDSELSNNGNTTSVKPPSIEDIKAIASQQKATLVEYSIIADQYLYIWVIKPTGEINFRQIDLQNLANQNSDLKFNQLVIDTRNSIFSRISNRSTEKFKTLNQILIQPIADLLPNNPEESVIFIPQGSLFLIPFAALIDQQDQYLINKHTILISPSIQTLQFTHQQKLRNQQINPQNTTIVGIPRQSIIVGNPTMPSVRLELDKSPQPLNPLPGAEAEAKAVAQVLENQALTGNQAIKARVIQQMLGSKIIHLATHGLLDDLGRKGIPGAIALAPSNNDDGLLTAAEILDLKLNADLVILSACNTGRGKITGDGVIGLSRSFLGAGASSIIVSLWAVQDESTAYLMPEFYRQLEQNANKAQALRQAMLQTMQQYSKPEAWAAFTLIGESN